MGKTYIYVYRYTLTHIRCVTCGRLIRHFISEPDGSRTERNIHTHIHTYKHTYMHTNILKISPMCSAIIISMRGGNYCTCNSLRKSCISDFFPRKIAYIYIIYILQDHRNIRIHNYTLKTISIYI